MNTQGVLIRVSFDLDEVLFVNPATHATEPELPFPKNRIYKERLRAGTPQLIHDLQQEGIEVWIYTTSFRSEKYIKRLFRSYGVRFDGIVNGQRHQNEVQGNRKEPMPTKMPNRYRISLHIDDEDVVVSYGRTYGFDVYQLNKQNDNWHDEIMEKVHHVRRMKEAQIAEAAACKE